MWERCLTCNKPLVDISNLLKLRTMIMVFGIGGNVLAMSEQPVNNPKLYGSDLAERRSEATRWQSYVGTVTANTIFAILQSSGDTDLEIVLFGCAFKALSIITSYAANTGWCTCTACNAINEADNKGNNASNTDGNYKENNAYKHDDNADNINADRNTQQNQIRISKYQRLWKYIEAMNEPQ